MSAWERFHCIEITILCQFKCWKYCFQAQMSVKMFLRFQPPDPPFLFGTNQTCLWTPRFFRILPIMYDFPNHWSMEILFHFCFVLLLFFFFLRFCFIIFLHWAAWILFLISNNKGFPFGPLLMFPSFLSMEEFGSDVQK